MATAQSIMKISESTAADRSLVDDRLVEFNAEQLPFLQSDPWIDLSHVCRDEEGEVIAGINATLYCWKIMHVDVLFVDEQHRGKGLGRQLLQAAESKAKTQGVHMAHLDTFDWQAKDFYMAQGYTVFGVLEDCPAGRQRHYMAKRF